MDSSLAEVEARDKFDQRLNGLEKGRMQCCRMVNWRRPRKSFRKLVEFTNLPNGIIWLWAARIQMMNGKWKRREYRSLRLKIAVDPKPS